MVSNETAWAVMGAPSDLRASIIFTYVFRQ